MKYKIIWISLVVVVCIVSGLFANQKLMEYRYKQINREFLIYREAEKSSYTQQLKKYQNVKRLLTNYLKRYPSKDQSIAIEESKLLSTNLRLEDFLKIEPILTMNAKAESDLFTCAWLVAKNKYPKNYLEDIRRDEGIKDQMLIEILGYDSENPDKNKINFSFLGRGYPQLFKYSNMAMMLAKAGRYKEAQEILMILEQANFERLIRISLLAQHAIKNNYKNDAKELLDFLVEFSKDLSLGYSSEGLDGLFLIADGYRQLGQTKEYYQSLERMFLCIEEEEEYNSEYSLLVFPIVDGLLELGNKDLAIKALKIALTRMAIPVDDEPLRYFVDFKALTKIMIRLDGLNQSSLANQAFDYIKNKDDQARIYLALADQYFKNQPKKAIDSLQKAKELMQAIEPIEYKIETSLEILEAYHKNMLEIETLSEMDNLLELLTKSSQNDTVMNRRSDIYLDAVDTLLQFDKPIEAITFADQKILGEEKSMALFKVAEYYLKNNQIQQAENLTKYIGWGHRTNLNSNINEKIAWEYYENKNMNQALSKIGKIDKSSQSNFYVRLSNDAIETKNIALAKSYLYKAYELNKDNEYFNSKESHTMEILNLSIQLEEEGLIEKILSSGKAWKDYLLTKLTTEYLKQNNTGKFWKYYNQLNEERIKNEVLFEASSPNTPEEIREFVYSEAVKSNNRAIISVYLYNQAIKLIEQKEYEKALQLVEKMDFDYDKATILTLLAIHWEKPNLGGDNAAIMHRIVAGCQ
jgi:hypothetical protein